MTSPDVSMLEDAAAPKNDNGLDVDLTSSVEDKWRPYDTPKIRHITGVRIHQLTLPESLSYASKLVSTSNEDDAEGYVLSPLGECSRRRRLSNSSTTSYPFPGRSIGSDRRERSSSTSTARPNDPQSPTISLHHTLPRSTTTRVTRPRAPTLAGEAIEHGNSHSQTTGTSLLGRSGSRDEYDNLDDIQQQRKPLRCFIAFRFPDTKPELGHRNEGEEDDLPRRRIKSDERDLRTVNGIGGFASRQKLTRGNLSNSVSSSLPNTPIRPSMRDTISSSLSNSSINQHLPDHDQPRSRTISLTTPKKTKLDGNDIYEHGRSLGRTTSRISDTASIHSTNSFRSPIPSSFRSPNLIGKSKASLSISHQSAHAQNQAQFSPTQETRADTQIEEKSDKINGSTPTEDKSLVKKDKKEMTLRIKQKEKATKPVQQIQVPFYISPIHPPSTNPRFLNLEIDDFANWVTLNEFSKDQFILEIWIELPSINSFGSADGIEQKSNWKKLDGVGGLVNLSDLRIGPTKEINGIEFTLSHNPKEIYHLPSTEELANQDNDSHHKDVNLLSRGKSIMERSLRETRMKRGVGFGGLHQLINLQAVIADTERSIEQVRRKVDKLLLRDSDLRCLKREISERESRVEWFETKVKEVEKTTRETQARIILKQQNNDTRRDNLDGAEEADELRRGRGRDLEEEIGKIENERSSLLPQIHSLRAHHIQTLDLLFPIQPLDPSHLLYTILNVPLPIPIGSKDPAPPLTMTEFKVDEKTTAAALGYVALIVQILGNLGGATGGLPYTLTCAGSRSSVRDGTGVMQGPRSFPLYAKGVERFRYEYAVFLLNKNIEMLMQESTIRLLDLRHTLPNLKNLLLTLSSPNLPHQPSSSINKSRVGSRSGSYRSSTPTLFGSSSGGGGWSRNSPSSWQNQNYINLNRSVSPTSESNQNRSPLKSHTHLLNPSPLRPQQSHQNKKYGNIKKGIDLTSEAGTDRDGEKIDENEISSQSAIETDLVA
ncbi:uncharacterized protein L201_000146 [Kwoniella dendrophila CBS 6074]|uniref:UV radiation resistance-associated gene protein n=1 Tax=Kwoniella dendrophila CBS 6074 TaxID=1295534 RepID=A0AAX4JKJ7_9TREE